MKKYTAKYYAKLLIEQGFTLSEFIDSMDMLPNSAEWKLAVIEILNDKLC